MFYPEIAFVFILGLLFGSFSTALIHRVPQKTPWWGGARSACSSCGHVLGALQLIPVFSWVLSRGRCSFCSARVSGFYPLSEIICAFLCVGAYLSLGLSGHAVFLIFAIPFLYALFVIDLQKMILPNQLVLILFCLGAIRLLYQVYLSPGIWPDVVTPYLLGCVFFAVIPFAVGWVMSFLLGKNSLGMGDVKFFGVAGLWVGIEYLAHFMILSGVIGILFYMVWFRITGRAHFPFGPSLILSFYLLLIGQGSVL